MIPKTIQKQAKTRPPSVRGDTSPNPTVVSVTQDCFYKNLTPEERDQAYHSNYNFDHPNAFDWGQQLDVIEKLRSGTHSKVAVPSYDFVTHSRLPSEHDTHVCSPEIVIFEGILALHDEELREHFDLKVYVDADADLRLARRISCVCLAISLWMSGSRPRTVASLISLVLSATHCSLRARSACTHTSLCRRTCSRP